MGRNVEIKARLKDPMAVRRRAESVATEGPFLLRQRDTFFQVPRGRLKLRRLVDRAELIFYERADDETPTESRYSRYPVADPDALEEMLTVALGTRGVVAKERTLFLAGQTRIHLDGVEGLGSFLELEVVLREDQTTADGQAIAEELLRILGVARQDLVAEAYVDLLAAEEHA